MKYILFAILMLLVSESWGQVKVYTNVDQVTGDTSFETKEYPLVVNHHGKKDSSIVYSVKAYLRRKGNNKHYNLAIMFDSYVTMSLDKGYRALFKLANNDVITGDYIGGYEIHAEGDQVFYYISLTNVIEKLRDADITNIHLDTSKGNVDIELTDYKHLISQLFQALQNY